jgi:hypothetical protein
MIDSQDRYSASNHLIEYPVITNAERSDAFERAYKGLSGLGLLSQ